MSRPILKTAALLAVIATPIACGSDSTDPETAADVEVNADVDLLPVNQSRPLEALALDASGDIIWDADVEYRSSSTSIATINDRGIYTGVGDGVVTFTGTVDAVSDDAQVGIYDIGDLCGNALLLNLGESVRSSLQAGDCDELIEDGSFVDIWAFDLALQRDVTIRMTSNDLDAFLWLIDEADQQVVNDNGAGGTNAEIRATLPAGSYLILANHFPGAQGAYTLYLASGVTADPTLGSVAVEPSRALTAARKVRTPMRTRVGRH